jgi:hypothetical protein
MNFADQEEIDERQKHRRHKRQNNLIWNVLTAIFIIISLIAISYFGLLFADPKTSLNPFPPPTIPALIQLPTNTPTVIQMPATWTLTATATSVPTSTPTQVEVTGTGTGTGTAESNPTPLATVNNSKYPFASKGDPAAMANTVFHHDKDCNWQGIAGQVWDIQGNALVGYRVHLQGFYNGKNIDLTTLSGGAQYWYGSGGYEFVIGDKAIDSTGQLSIQMEDQSYMLISNKVVLNTYSDCTKNLIMVNFQQVR